jgi:type IV pilus assembly protein PilX
MFQQTQRMRARTISSRRHQKGVVATLTAIIVLVATLLALTALLTSVDTSNAIAGNLGFRQGLSQEAERAYASAIALVPFDGVASETDHADTGYSAIILAPDATRADLPGVLTGALSAASPPVGVVSLAALTSTSNNVYYVVERLCTAPGAASSVNCVVPRTIPSGGSISGESSDSNERLQLPLAAYRLSVRVDGPRGTSGYVQTILR